MMEAAVGGRRCGSALVGVTVLTSHDAASYGRAVGRTDVDLDARSRRGWPSRRRERGLAGVVCSPREVALVRARLGAGRASSCPESGAAPTRRRSGAGCHAAEAAAAGRPIWWSGRPVIQAADPAAAFNELLEEAQCVGS